MCSLFLVLRLLITTAVRFIKKENHQRLLLWEVSVVQQCPSVVASLQIAALREPVPELIAEITLPGITPPVIAQA